MDKIILALDASSTNVGYCIAQGEVYIRSNVYTPKGTTDERVRKIVTWLRGSLVTYDPDVVAVEEPMGHHRNLKTDRLLARVYGGIEAVCILSSIPVIPVHPMAVKATHISKDNIAMAAMLAGKQRVKPDEADALGIWRVALGVIAEQRLQQIAKN